MKIDIRQVPSEGLVLTEAFNPSSLDLETETIKFSGPVIAKAHVSIITNALTIHLALSGLMHLACSCCLDDFEFKLAKEFDLNYSIKESEPFIDLNPQIREEIIIDYPIKSLCRRQCLGLCPKCGKNLNEGKCNCVRKV
ncbi:MAG: DUF177 domain-containing protein [Candidatus Omnitrophota bacterium]